MKQENDKNPEDKNPPSAQYLIQKKKRLVVTYNIDKSMKQQNNKNPDGEKKKSPFMPISTYQINAAYNNIIERKEKPKRIGRENLPQNQMKQRQEMS